MSREYWDTAARLDQHLHQFDQVRRGPHPAHVVALLRQAQSQLEAVVSDPISISSARNQLHGLLKLMSMYLDMAKAINSTPSFAGEDTSSHIR
jgi:hypothetical protein